MKTIKRKILTPFLILITVIPLATLLIFNIAMRYYVQRSARADLLSTVKTMDTLIKKELSGKLFEFSDAAVGSAYLNLNVALKASKFASNTELVLFNKKLELIYPKNPDNAFLDKPIIEKITAELSTLNKGKVYKVDSDGKSYIMMGYKLSKNLDERALYIIFLSGMNAADRIIETTNIILLIIMLIGVGVGIFIANITSEKIVKPVKRLCKITDDIGEGELTNDEEKTDILELSQLSCSITQMSAKIAAFNNTQKTFLQNASHELKTPLMSIQGYAEGIESGVLSDSKKAAAVIVGESKRLHTIVDELLTLSRIESRAYENQIKRIDLLDVLKDCVERLDGLALIEQIKLLSDLPYNPAFIMADDTLLSKAIINVASNCIRYAKSQVEIRLSVSGGSATVKIQDDGNGISEKDLPYLFDRFYKGEGGNFGLGLSIAKSAVEFMGGNIRANNTDNGAVFEIILPVI